MSGDRVVDSVREAMPRVWSVAPDLCAEFATGVGGNSVALVRVVDPVTGAHLALGEDAQIVCAVFSDSGENCEGHPLSVDDDPRSPVWWFRHGTVPSGPCGCLSGGA